MKTREEVAQELSEYFNDSVYWCERVPEAGTEDDPRSGYNAGWVDTHDGRVVWCLNFGHALSCDWANAK